jgi:hypothetical protein
VTPIVLLVLVGMWAAVLLPPYLRDRRETRAAGPSSPVGSRLSALTRSLGQKGKPGYLPVNSAALASPQEPGSPLPAGARHPITHRGAPQAVPDLPETSAFKITGPARTADPLAISDDAAYLLAPEDELDDGVEPLPARAESIPRPVMAARAARKRRREVLYTLLAASGLSLLMAIGLGGAVIALHLLIDVLLVGYVVMLVRLQKARAEREIKVAFLPHGGQGVSPAELLAQGGGFRPGEVGVELAPVEIESTAFRVVRSQAN